MAKIIGNKDCSVISVCNALSHTSAFELAPSDWFKLVKDFIGDGGILLAKEISDCIEYKGYSLNQAYRILLDTWIAKVGLGVTLDSLVDVLDKHELFDAADALRKRFDCKPKSIDDLVIAIQDLDVGSEEKKHIYKNISQLADVTNVTEDLLTKLNEKKIISQDEVDELKKVDEDNKGLALFSIISRANSVLPNLIRVLDEDGQFSPSWILRDFYVWAVKNKGSLKTKSTPNPENVQNGVSPNSQTQPIFYSIRIPKHSYVIIDMIPPEYSSIERPLFDLINQNVPIC